jgi:hypothetical protein
MGICRGTLKLVVLWVRLETGFLQPFLLTKGRDVSRGQTEVSWEGDLSPWPIITFWDLWQSVLQFPPLSDHPNCYNRDNEVYSVMFPVDRGQ